jgi:hypothetical protein
MLAIGLMWLTAYSFQTVFWVAVVPAFLAVGLLLFTVQERERPVGLRKLRSPFSLAELKRLGPAWLCSVQGARAIQRSFLPFMPTGKAKPTRWRDIALPGSRLFSISAAASA